MSSEMFMFEEPFYPHLSSLPQDMLISSTFFSDLPSDSSIDSLLHDHHHSPVSTALSSTGNNHSAAMSGEEAHSLDQLAHTLLANSPPSHQLETLTLSRQTQLGNLPDSGGFSDVKTEDFAAGFDGGNQGFFMGESLVKFMQRSYSSNSFEGKPAVFFQPQFDAVVEGPPENVAGGGQMRRVCSTGDLPEVRMDQTSQQREGNLMMEEGNFKVGRYSAEERRERIDRYRAKRTQRNFNKTIKYACRKTLADNRPRIRGRFARNDETGEIPKPTSFQRYEDDDDLWVDSAQEEEDDGILGRGGRFLNNIGGTHFQYCGY